MTEYFSLLYCIASSLLIICLLVKAIVDCFLLVSSVQRRDPQQRDHQPEEDDDSYVMAVIHDDDGRRMTSTRAMNDENDDTDIERQIKRRRICCNSPLPCLEDFLHIKVLTEHDIEIMAATRSCKDNANHVPASPSGELIQNETSQREKANDDIDNDTTDNHEHHDERNNESLCSICLSDMKPGDKVVVTQCGHAFHAKCMSRWFFSRKQSKNHPNSVGRGCPMCRTEILPLASTTP
jgi:hypothetical protein